MIKTVATNDRNAPKICAATVFGDGLSRSLKLMSSKPRPSALC